MWIAHGLLDYSWLYWITTITHGFTGLLMVLLDYLWFYWIKYGYTGLLMVLLDYSWFYWITHGFAGLLMVLLDYYCLYGLVLVLWITDDDMVYQWINSSQDYSR